MNLFKLHLFSHALVMEENICFKTGVSWSQFWCLNQQPKNMTIHHTEIENVSGGRSAQNHQRLCENWQSMKGSNPHWRRWWWRHHHIKTRGCICISSLGRLKAMSPARGRMLHPSGRRKDGGLGKGAFAHILQAWNQQKAKPGKAWRQESKTRDSVP